MKDFLDVFPGLHMTEQMQELLSLVGVERVSMPRGEFESSFFLENRSRSESLNGSVCLSSIHRKSF